MLLDLLVAGRTATARPDLQVPPIIAPGQRFALCALGDTTIGVKINGELKPLRTTLQNGDVVEVIRGGKPVVPPDWRSLTVTGRARSAIRRHKSMVDCCAVESVSSQG